MRVRQRYLSIIIIKMRGESGTTPVDLALSSDEQIRGIVISPIDSLLQDASKRFQFRRRCDTLGESSSLN